MARFRIAKQFTFSASHRLAQLPETHQCYRLHGHNYTVEVVLSAETMNTDGFVLDYNLFAPFEQHLKDTVDHTHLNDLFDLTSAEYLAQRFFRRASELLPARVVSVRVSETPKTWAEYSEEDDA